jgi:hypothetical protein
MARPVIRSLRIAVAVSAALSAGVSTACDRAASSERADSAEETALEVEHLLGDGSEALEFTFGRIGGLAIDAKDRLYVADSQADAVRVFSPAGEFLFDIGRTGSGPGEFVGPCCIAIDARQRLWVRDGDNARYDIFTVGDTGATYLHSIRMAHSDVNRWAPVTFDGAGNVVDIGTHTDPATRVSVDTRFHLDSTGSVIRKVAMHQIPDDSIGLKKVERKITGGVATMYAYQPHGPNEMTAHGPGGVYAHGVTSRYEIDWRDESGALVRHISQPIGEGPQLSARERALADTSITELATRLGVSRLELGFDVPDRKQPLRSMFFDGTGHLWVQLSSADGEARRAHVWSPDGKLVRTVVWPAMVDMRDNAISESTLWAIARDSLDTTVPVKLRLATRAASRENNDR